MMMRICLSSVLCNDLFEKCGDDGLFEKCDDGDVFFLKSVMMMNWFEKCDDNNVFDDDGLF